MLKQKDEIIKNLKGIIDMITQNNRQRKGSDGDGEQLRAEIRILTIENQKLIGVIDKINRNKNIEENTVKISQEYEYKLDQLMKTLKQNEFYHEEETK